MTNDVPELVAFNRDRAQIERQMGTNQLLCGNESGKNRIIRANMHDASADQFALMQNEIILLQNTIESLKSKAKKEKE